MGVITELVTIFSFKGSTKPLDDFNNSFKKSLGMLSKGLIAFAGIDLAFKAFTFNALESVQSLNKLNYQTGISVEKLQELGFAASASGSSIESMESSLVGLSQKIGQAALSGSADFSRLGVSVMDAYGNIKKADEVIFEIGKRFKELNLSMPEQQNFASALGIDTSLLRLLNKSTKEIDNLRKKAREFGVITKEDAEKAEIFSENINILKFGLTSLQKQISIGLAPAMTEIAEKFTDFLLVNKDLIKDGLAKTFEIMGYLFGSIKRMLTFVDDLISSTIGWKTALVGLGVVVAVLNPISTIIIGILAVIDDLIVAFKGGKSLIRDFFQEFLGVDITPILQGLVEGFKQAIETIKSLFSNLFGFIKNGIFGSISQSIDKFKNIFGVGENNPDKLIASTAVNNKNYLSDPKSSANNTINQNVSVSVKSTDPVLAGKTVANNIENQLEIANYQLNNGGR